MSLMQSFSIAGQSFSVTSVMRSATRVGLSPRAFFCTLREAVGRARGLGVLRDASAPPAAPPPPGSARRQWPLQASAHTADGPVLAASPGGLNVAHVEGVVREVACGAGRGRSGPEVVVQLWLDPAEGGGGAPLSVRCGLLREVPEAAAAAAGVAEGALAWYAERLRRELKGRRVVVSGRMRVEQRYDAEADKVVEVPYIHLPSDGLHLSYHIIS